jgi:hypothetical protein
MTVVNMKGLSEDAIRQLIRVDRKTRWGNPFVMRNEAQREAVVSRYRVWLWDQIKSGKVRKQELAFLHGKQLGCWCAPRACHADILVKAAAWAVKQ